MHWELVMFIRYSDLTRDIEIEASEPEFLELSQKLRAERMLIHIREDLLM